MCVCLEIAAESLSNILSAVVQLGVTKGTQQLSHIHILRGI